MEAGRWRRTIASDPGFGNGSRAASPLARERSAASFRRRRLEHGLGKDGPQEEAAPADRAGAGTARTAGSGRGRARSGRRVRVGGAQPAPAAGAARGRRAVRAPVRHRARGRGPLRQHASLRARVGRQQRPPLGCARHGQELAGEGGARPPERAGARLPRADRDPPRGHREPAPAPAPPGPFRTALPALLRRPQLRRRRDQLQVPEGGAGGRDRGPARPTCSSTPPPTAAT